MVLTMMPQIAVPTSAKERKTTEKSKVANATEFMSIEEFDEDAQIVSGGYYIFSANITADKDMSESDRKNRVLKSSNDIHYGMDEEDAIDEKECSFSDYNTVNWGRNEKFVYQITETNSTDEGNQGYIIRNAYFNNYLDVKQDLQHGRTTLRPGQTLSVVGSDTLYPIYQDVFPTYPFVYQSNNQRVWYWDKENKEFYTRFTTRSFDDDHFGYGNAFLPYYRSYYDPQYEQNFILARDCDDGQGNAGLARLIFLNNYIYCDPYTMGLYAPGYYAGELYLIRDKTDRSNAKLVLSGIHGDQREDNWGFTAVEELRDPHNKWGYSNNRGHDLTTAFLGVYNDNMLETFNKRGGEHSDFARAEKQHLSIFKEVTSPEITFDYNDGTGGKRTQNIHLGQNIDLSTIKPYDETGSDFLGWSTEKHGEIITNLSAVENTTLYAQWKEINVNLTVVNGKFGSVEVLEPENFDGKVYKGDTFKAKATPNSNKTFNGWSISSSEGTDSSYDYEYETTCNTDLDITATFGVHPLYSLTLNLNYNDGSENSRQEEVYKYDTYDLSQFLPYEETGSDFLGWSLQPHGDIINSIKIYSNEYLYAQWKKLNISATPNDTNMGSVTVNNENFDGTLYKGENLSVTASAKERARFKGWKIGNEIVSTDATYEVKCTTDLAISAEFEWTADHWKDVTLNYNDGTNGFRVEKIVHGEEFDPAKFTPYEETGDDFLGWSTEEHGRLITAFDVTEASVLYAQWKELSVTVESSDEIFGKVTVNKENFDGTLYKGENLSVTATPEEGFDFKGWKVGDNIVSAEPTYETMYTQDTVLTALFECTSHHENEAITKATLDTDGVIVHTCDVCGNELSRHIIKHPEKFELSSQAFTYSGAEQKPAVTVKDADGNKIDTSNYDVLYSNNKNAGKATVKITFKGSFYSGTKTINFTINKAKNKLTVKGKKYKIKQKKLKKKSKKIKLSKVMKCILNGQGNMNFVKVSGSKKIKINTSTGKITVKKKIKKGTYKVKIKVMARGDANHEASEWETVTIKIKVKK